MLFDFDGEVMEADVVGARSFRSSHTGAQLRLMTIVMDGVADEKGPAVAHVLRVERRKNRFVDSLDDEGQVTGSWRIVKTDHVTSVHPDTKLMAHRFTVELEQRETFNIRALRVGPLTFTPYAYQEELVRGTVVIKARVRMSEEGYAAFKQMQREHDAFVVVREGVSDEPLRMRFAESLWSRGPDGIRHEINLLETRFDDRRQATEPFEPQLHNIGDAVVEQGEILDELLNLLVEGDVVPAERVDALRRRALENAWERRLRFNRVDDIDRM